MNSKPPTTTTRKIADQASEDQQLDFKAGVSMVQNGQMPMGSYIGSLQFHNLMSKPSSRSTSESITSDIISFIKYNLGRDSATVDSFGMYQATTWSIRTKLIDNWNTTMRVQAQRKARSVNYLSLEFLMGRALTNSLYNMEIGGTYKAALQDLGFKLEDLQAEESDAALGNGGLGRLAACFIDSLACLEVPAYGYSIRYNYGMFKQGISPEGHQVEAPEYWLKHGSSPFPLVERLDKEYTVRFYGYTTSEPKPTLANPKRRIYKSEGGELVRAVAYDCLCPALHSRNVACLRLWSARANSEFNLYDHFSGDYYAAIRAKADSENITFVLYPADNTDQGKLLRLKQEYFFVSASLQDIIWRCEKELQAPLTDLPKYFAIQLNDTHPVLGIPELMRLLMDQYGFEWNEAWSIVRRCFSYTNHTVLPEALEKWNLGICQKLLPRVVEIISEINRRFMVDIAHAGSAGSEAAAINDVSPAYKPTPEELARLSIFEESFGNKNIRMANLAIIGAQHVNGVAALHSEIIKSSIFAEFNQVFPGKFLNVTNGVTPRRWIAQANPLLSHFITKSLVRKGVIKEEHEWLLDMEQTKHLDDLAGDTAALSEITEIKRLNKLRLLSYIERHVDPAILGPVTPAMADMIFDTQVKRIHEYKRQMMNILQTVYFYILLKTVYTSDEDRRKAFGSGLCKIFAGKAASAYTTAKKTILLINSIARVVNNDDETRDFLRVVFIPNYNVSSAEIIFPATEVSEQISTAGLEASGTGNMKACMNGGIILGTLDGANVEIKEHVGDDNIFIFGCETEAVVEIRNEYAAGRKIEISENLGKVLDVIDAGMFGPAADFQSLTDTIRAGNDWYLVSVDFESYNYCYLNEVIPLYKNKAEWCRMALCNIARMWYFSSDRSIRDYCEKIWHVKPCKIGYAGEGSTRLRNSGMSTVEEE